eukprot:4778368-Pyramimonas_sp.AAC.1
MKQEMPIGHFVTFECAKADGDTIGEVTLHCCHVRLRDPGVALFVQFQNAPPLDGMGDVQMVCPVVEGAPGAQSLKCGTISTFLSGLLGEGLAGARALKVLIHSLPQFPPAEVLARDLLLGMGCVGIQKMDPADGRGLNVDRLTCK